MWAPAVVDCRGFAEISRSGDRLLRGLLRDGLITPNPSNLGLRVNEDFEAAPGLAVLGPLLAGTSQGEDHIWHLEDIPRIFAYAARVAATVGAANVRAA